MEVAAAASGETAKSAVVHLEREFGYVLHFKGNVKTLRDKQRRLAAALNDVETLITLALDNDELIRQTVRDWQSRAGSAHEEANQLIAEAEHVNSWFKGWCCSRFSLGRKAEKKNALIQGLLDERSAVGDTVSDPKPFQALAIPPDRDYNVFASRKIVTKQVIEALSDEKISLVGVHGMPGVGKTMLIKAVAKQVKEEKLFEEVVIVMVSQNPVLEKVQGDIANGLGLNLPEKDTSIQIAARLWERLNKRKAVLIVLDDVWEKLDLAAVGIPLKSNNSNGCKVVFTTREAGVCNQMEADDSVGVPVLTEKDSWFLFCQKAGDDVHSVVPASLRRELVSECKGLPLAIAILGLALKNNNEVAVWNNALTQLKKSMVHDRVFASIRLSYDFLQNETTKMCFLFCSLFPEDASIDTEDLLRYLIGEDLLRNVDSVEESRELLQSLVAKLVSSNLLSKAGYRGRYYGLVMMHDVVRDVAISIASKDEKLGFIVEAGMGPAHWPNVKKLSDCKRLSVMENKLRCDLPYKIQAPQLLTLSMRDNWNLNEIPDDFFNGMGNLLTLDISETRMSSLPPSLSCLVNLRTLLIEGCELEDIHLIEGLEKLEILSLYKTDVSDPSEIDTRKLRNLKSLDLLKSTGISAKKFDNMCQLEELSMGDIAFVDGVESLTRLTSLMCCLPDIHLSADPRNLEKLIRFFIGCGRETSSDIKEFFSIYDRSTSCQRLLCLEIPKERFPLANWVLVLIARAEVLVLLEGDNIESVGELDAHGTGMNDLIHLVVRGLKNMKYLINSMAGKARKDAFSSLQELGLERMDNFEALCNGEFTDRFLCNLRKLDMADCSRVINLIPADLLLNLHNLEKLKLVNCTRLEKLIHFEERDEACALVATYDKSTTTSISVFPNLRSLRIDNCPQLEYVFQLKVARDLLQLRELYVTDCPKLKTIIEGSIDEGSNNGQKNILILPQLKSLRLKQLPELSRLSPPGLNIDCPHLEDIRIQDCWKLKKLPFRSDSLSKLERLYAQQPWFDELEWDHEEAKHHLYTKLILL